ncbi:hypothetical protein FNV43_RR08371 [Rhamnella rubrinervis]|uniref:Glycosyltransferase n=1 Tax=Rhamnella rubrinervis TaxID=2594499 RepID=A0A8K0MJ69_9ROSA|nr:hypothetical protein FNV43_RR08371 [Rhamnella rubrinervis]
MEGEIFVVTGPGQGHLNPCMELCKHLASRNYQTTLVVPSTASFAIPSSFTQNTSTRIVHVAGSSGPSMPGPDPFRDKSGQDLEAHLANRSKDSARPLCAIIDFQMGWTKRVFWKFHIPFIGFFTFGACAAAMEMGAWKVQAGDIKPGEIRSVSGLPEDMALEHLDTKRRPEGPPRDHPHASGPDGPKGGGGPPKPGDRPPWVPEIEDQEHTRQSNYNEDDVIQWLDSKPRGSVLYVAFGSEVGPSKEEYPQLTMALEESTRPFIWVIQPGSGIPGSTESKVGERGLIICGWAPQLLILSHPSTGGFLSHCGWNSTVEAICRGVPLLEWPFRGDQYYNAKWVVKHLKVGHRVAEDPSEMVRKDDIRGGIEKVMVDVEIKKMAGALRGKLENGFPASSEAALDAFGHFISQRKALYTTK